MRHRGAALIAAVLIVTIAGWSADAAPVVDSSMAVPAPQVRGAIAHVVPTTSTRSPTSTTQPPATTLRPADELATRFVGSINRLRASDGLGELSREADLDRRAQAWAETMADEEMLHHSEIIYEVIEGPWVAAGENLAKGPTTDSMFAGLEASAPHRENMVNADYTHVGIGVVVRGRTIWTVHLFAG